VIGEDPLGTTREFAIPRTTENPNAIELEKLEQKRDDERLL